VEHFVNSQAQDIAIHGCDAMEIPVGGVLLYFTINGVSMFESPPDERFCEQADVQLFRSGRWEFHGLAPVGGSFVFGDGCRALRLPELV